MLTDKDRTAKGVRIYNKRRERGLNQRQLGKEVGVSHAMISNWESGTSVFEMSARNEASLVRALRTNEKWLNTGQGSDGPEGAMSEDEIALIELYRKMSDTERERLMHYADFSSKQSEG